MAIESLSMKHMLTDIEDDTLRLTMVRRILMFMFPLK